MRIVWHLLHLARNVYYGAASGMSVEPFRQTSDTEHCSLLTWSVSVFYVFRSNYVFVAEGCMYYCFCEFYTSSAHLLWIRSFSIYSKPYRLLNTQYCFDLVPLGLNGFWIINRCLYWLQFVQVISLLLLPYLCSTANDKYSIWISPSFAGLLKLCCQSLVSVHLAVIFIRIPVEFRSWANFR